MKKKKIMLPLLIVGFIILSSIIGVTYAFWSQTITLRDNSIKTGYLALLVNGADGKDEVGTTLQIENLYPSFIYYEEEQIVIMNTGTIDLKYKVTFANPDPANELIYSNILVSFDNGVNWTNIAEADYIDDLLTVESSETITVLFRLNPELEDLTTMDQDIELDINVKAIQVEDTF